MVLSTAKSYNTKRKSWLKVSRPRIQKSERVEISQATLSMMDTAIANLKKGIVSEAVDLTDFEV